MSETKNLNAIAQIYCNNAILLEDTGFTSKVRGACSADGLITDPSRALTSLPPE